MGSMKNKNQSSKMTACFGDREYAGWVQGKDYRIYKKTK